MELSISSESLESSLKGENSKACVIHSQEFIKMSHKQEFDMTMNVDNHNDNSTKWSSKSGNNDSNDTNPQNDVEINEFHIKCLLSNKDFLTGVDAEKYLDNTKEKAGKVNFKVCRKFRTKVFSSIYKKIPGSKSLMRKLNKGFFQIFNLDLEQKFLKLSLFKIFDHCILI